MVILRATDEEGNVYTLDIPEEEMVPGPLRIQAGGWSGAGSGADTSPGRQRIGLTQEEADIEVTRILAKQDRREPLKKWEERLLGVEYYYSRCGCGVRR